MRSVPARVVKGKVTTRARLPEGAKLTVFVHEAADDVELTESDEAAIAKGIADIQAGRFVKVEAVRSFLRRR